MGAPAQTEAIRNPEQPGYIYTFYSYKGGVGRSMALANVGVLMALAGKHTLLIDWDLEAPGLEVYFQNAAASLEGDPSTNLGIVDLLEGHASGHPVHWKENLLRAKFLGTSLDILSAGKRSDDYRARVQKLDWATLYGEHRIGNFIDSLREEWRKTYDFVLVDSRTGISDIGDVCTVLLPDAIVLMFVTNHQNVWGIKALMERATEARKRLPVNRNKLLGVPIPARDEVNNEYEKSSEWKRIFSSELGYLFADWLPRGVESEEALNRLSIPYVTNWSFGERIPVLESTRETQDPKTIGAAYSRVAALLMNHLDWNVFEQRATAAELQGTRVELSRAREEARATKEELSAQAGKSRRRWAIAATILVFTIGIVAAIAIPAYQDYVVRAKVVEGLAAADSAKIAVAEFVASNGRFPNSNSELSVSPDSTTFVQTVAVEKSGVISVRYRNDVPQIGDKSLELTPVLGKGSQIVSWTCRSADIAQKLLPSLCRDSKNPTIR